jgi:hypothetical protein
LDPVTAALQEIWGPNGLSARGTIRRNHLNARISRVHHDDEGPDFMNSSINMEQIDVQRIELAVLRQEHRDLDDAISALQDRHSADVLTIKRLKKQKLALKDKIFALEDKVTPDIIA